jgi:hypothetical protein
MFKVELEVEKNGGYEEEEKMKKPTPLQKKVAMMLAKQNGRKKPNEMDIMKAAKIEEDDENGD